MEHNMSTTELGIDLIRDACCTQAGLSIDEGNVNSFVKALTDGHILPPVVVFFDGFHYHLADGLHRLIASRKTGAATIAADVRQGSLMDATLFALGANQRDRMLRSKRYRFGAVVRMLVKFADWSDHRIATYVDVSTSIVGAIRSEAQGSSGGNSVERSNKTKHGGAASQKEAVQEDRPAKAPSSEPPKEVSTDECSHAAVASPGDVAAPSCPEDIDELNVDLAPDAEEIADAQRAESEMLETFRAVLALDDSMGEAVREVHRLNQVNRGLQSRVDGLMLEKNAAISRIKALQRKLDQL